MIEIRRRGPITRGGFGSPASIAAASIASSSPPSAATMRSALACTPENTRPSANPATPRDPPRPVVRALEPAERVHHAERLGLPPGEPAPVGDPGPLPAIELASGGGRADELAVDVVEQGL